MNDKYQIGSTFHKKRVGKQIVMVEGPRQVASKGPKGRLAALPSYTAHVKQIRNFAWIKNLLMWQRLS
jgi:hypothetical protein